MRMTCLLRGDVRFQYKYGFYWIYLVFTALYISLLSALPEVWRGKAAILMIFTDPSAIGLYFMGAIVLFEKSERVLDSIAVSPVKPAEYVLSKLVSIGLIATLVALAIGAAAGAINHAFYFVVGVFLGSCLFSTAGLIVACRAATLNQFVIATIPAEILINVPAVAWLFGYQKGWLIVHPGVCLIQLLAGGQSQWQALLILLLWTALLYRLACTAVQKMLKAVGGVKL